MKEGDVNQPESSRGWSIHSRQEITSKYEIGEYVGSGIYRAIRRSNSAEVALKEVDHWESAVREIKALQILKGHLHVVELHDYFYSDDESTVLVLDYLPCTLASEIKAFKYGDGSNRREKIKQWMSQILDGVASCHRYRIVHADLQASSVLISRDGDAKIGNFHKAKILDARGFIGEDTHSDGLDKKRQRLLAPELLIGSKNYSVEADLWSLGCLFAHMLKLKPIFAGVTERDHLCKIIRILGNLTEEACGGCVELPFTFENVEKPIGLESILSEDEIRLVKRLLSYDPTKRANASDLLHDIYFRGD